MHDIISEERLAIIFNDTITYQGFLQVLYNNPDKIKTYNTFYYKKREQYFVFDLPWENLIIQPDINNNNILKILYSTDAPNPVNIFTGICKYGMLFQTEKPLYIFTEEIAKKASGFAPNISSGNWYTLKIFILNSPNIKTILHKNEDQKVKIIVKDSKIQEVNIKNNANLLEINRNIFIGKLTYENKDRTDLFSLERIENINFIKLKKGKISIRNSYLHLLDIEDPNSENISFQYCTFTYNEKILNEYHPVKFWDIYATRDVMLHYKTKEAEINDNIRHKKYINSAYNTFEFLKTVPSLKSEKLVIYRYAENFRSYRGLINRVLYKMHGGFYKIITPLAFLIFTLIAAYYTLANISYKYPDIKPNPIEYQLNPKLLLTDLIFHDSTAQGNFIFSKFVILFLTMFSYYSLFAFLAAIKRRFGYPKL